MVVETSGAGPDVFLLHGCPQPAADMRPLAEELSASHRTHLVHLPGYGGSPALNSPYSLWEAERALVAAIHDRSQGPIGLLGFSVGAYRALSLALLGELDVAALVLVAPFAHLSPANEQAFLSFAHALREGVDVLAPAIERCFGAAYRTAEPTRCEQITRGMLAAAPPELLGAELEAYARAPDLRPRLGALTSAVTLICGTEDPVVPVWDVKALASALPGATLTWLEGAGHCVIEERTDAVAKATLAGLAPLRRGRATGRREEEAC